jgi:hypothetical protein
VWVAFVVFVESAGWNRIRLGAAPVLRVGIRVRELYAESCRSSVQLAVEGGREMGEEEGVGCPLYVFGYPGTASPQTSN